MPHRRSQASRQRRAARRFVIEHAHYDKWQAESVAQTPSKQVVEHLKGLFEGVDVSAVDIELGEVLTDRRGRGSLQRVT